MVRELVFVGGGHAHLTALRNIPAYVARGHRVTVISPARYHYYSGMGPGLLSGIYVPQQVRFNIERMAEQRGARFVMDRVVRVDAGRRLLVLESGREVRYDVASFNTGSDVPSQSIAVREGSVVPVKPIVNLLRARREVLRAVTKGEQRLVVIGGGPAGVEITGNLWRLVDRGGGKGKIVLVAGDELLKGQAERVKALVRASFTRRGIEVIEGAHVSFVRTGEAQLSNGESIPADFTFLAVGVRPSSLFRDSGIAVGEDGGLLVNRCLQSVQHPELFGGGDCISFEPQPLRKVGVYAVRQNPILYRNLLSALEGRDLDAFDPGGPFLLIMNMGDGTGILWKGRVVLNGKLMFILKDYIDRRFMRRFQVSGEVQDGEDISE